MLTSSRKYVTDGGFYLFVGLNIFALRYMKSDKTPYKVVFDNLPS